MLKKYLTKFTIDILPSVAATVIGAYIVNHYIVTKPATDAPVAAVSVAAPKTAAKSPEVKTGDVGHLPAAGVKAKGISEKAIFEKTAAERPTVVEKVEAKADIKADVKADAKPAEVTTASIPGEARPTRSAAREKEKIRVVLPSPVQAVTPAVVVAPPSAPVVAPAVETTSVPDDRRDANDLARAAIERLRGHEASSHSPEVARVPESPRIDTPRIDTTRIETSRIEASSAATASALRPLPPPITVSTPSGGQASDQGRPPYAANASADPSRPTPPAEIPVSRPLDLRADAAEPSVRERTTAVAEDVLSTAKSLFHAVLPK